MNKEASIAIIINEKNQLLIGKRIPSGLYGTPGGKIENGETSEDALIRELYEETNLKVIKMEKMNTIYIPEWNVYPFKILEYYGELLNQEPNKSEPWKFVDIDSLKHLELIYCLRVLVQQNLIK